MCSVRTRCMHACTQGVLSQTKRTRAGWPQESRSPALPVHPPRPVQPVGALLCTHSMSACDAELGRGCRGLAALRLPAPQPQGVTRADVPGPTCRARRGGPEVPAVTSAPPTTPSPPSTGGPAWVQGVQDQELTPQGSRRAAGYSRRGRLRCARACGRRAPAHSSLLAPAPCPPRPGSSLCRQGHPHSLLQLHTSEVPCPSRRGVHSRCWSRAVGVEMFGCRSSGNSLQPQAHTGDGDVALQSHGHIPWAHVQMCDLGQALEVRPQDRPVTVLVPCQQLPRQWSSPVGQGDTSQGLGPRPEPVAKVWPDSLRASRPVGRVQLPREASGGLRGGWGAPRAPGQECHQPSRSPAARTQAPGVAPSPSAIPESCPPRAEDGRTVPQSPGQWANLTAPLSPAVGARVWASRSGDPGSLLQAEPPHPVCCPQGWLALPAVGGLS